MYINHNFNPNNLKTTFDDKHHVEQFLNFTGQIPLLSTVTGFLRVVIFTKDLLKEGTLVVANLAKTFFYYIQKNQEKLNESKNNLKEFSILTLHDLCNIFRGTIEMIAIFGNALCFIYNRSGLRFSYEQNDASPDLIVFGDFHDWQVNNDDEGVFGEHQI